MGNSISCCRLRWSSFTNSNDDLAAEQLSQYQFNHSTDNYSQFLVPNNYVKINSVSNYNHLLCYHNGIINLHIPSVEHICEREPDDETSRILLKKSCTTIFLRLILLFTRKNNLQYHLLKQITYDNQSTNFNKNSRWSSCGNVYIGSGCLSKPDSALVFNCVSLAISVLLKSEKEPKRSKNNKLYNIGYTSDCSPLIRKDSDQSPSLTSTINADRECCLSFEVYNDVYQLYDERAHPLFKPTAFSLSNAPSSQNPSECDPYFGFQFHDQILHFLNKLFSSSLLTAESAIVSLVYLERLITEMELNLVSWSWRRQLLSCILLACKVLDDQAVWNADYCQLLKDVPVEDLNQLERHTLSLLQFNTSVPPSVYAQYYFDLLSVGDLLKSVGSFQTIQQKMTSKIARQFRILPTSPEARAEVLVTTGQMGGGGLLFDLPCASPNSSIIKNNKLRRSNSSSGAISSKKKCFGEAGVINVFQTPTRVVGDVDVNSLPNYVHSTVHEANENCYENNLSDYESSESTNSPTSLSLSLSAWSRVSPSAYNSNNVSDTDLWTLERRDSNTNNGFGNPSLPTLSNPTNSLRETNHYQYFPAHITNLPQSVRKSFMGGSNTYSILQDSGLY